MIAASQMIIFPQERYDVTDFEIQVSMSSFEILFRCGYTFKEKFHCSINEKGGLLFPDLVLQSHVSVEFLRKPVILHALDFYATNRTLNNIDFNLFHLPSSSLFIFPFNSSCVR